MLTVRASLIPAKIPAFLACVTERCGESTTLRCAPVPFAHTANKGGLRCFGDEIWALERGQLALLIAGLADFDAFQTTHG